MRSITITDDVHQSQHTSGTRSSGEGVKLRRSCEQLAASRIRSSSSCRCLANSATTSQSGQRVEQGDVVVDDRRDARPENLDRHFAAVGQGRKVHLRHRGRGDRLDIETREDLADRFAVGMLEFGDRQRRGKRRHLVLQLGQFLGDVRRQQVAAGGQHLAELDEDGAKRLQGTTQALGAWRRQIAPEQRGADQPGRKIGRVVIEDQLIQAMAKADAGDLGETQ